MIEEFTPADEGKHVVTSDGSVVGYVETIRDGTAYVQPRSGLLEGYGSWLTGCWDDESTVPLDKSEVDRVGDRAILIVPEETTANEPPITP